MKFFIFLLLASTQVAVAKEGFFTEALPKSLQAAWDNTFQVVSLKPVQEPKTANARQFMHYIQQASAFPVKKQFIKNKCYVLMATAGHVVDEQFSDLGDEAKKHTYFLKKYVPPVKDANLFKIKKAGGFFSGPVWEKTNDLIQFEAEAESAKVQASIVDTISEQDKDMGAFLVEVPTADCNGITPLNVPHVSDCKSITSSGAQNYVIGYPKLSFRAKLESQEGAYDYIKRYSTGFFTAGNERVAASTADALQGNSGGPILRVNKLGKPVVVGLVKAGAARSLDNGDEIYQGDDKILKPHVLSPSCEVFAESIDRFWQTLTAKITNLDTAGVAKPAAAANVPVSATNRKTIHITTEPITQENGRDKAD